jgi:predicted MPP superfamily phosphohydrolase
MMFTSPPPPIVLPAALDTGISIPLAHKPSDFDHITKNRFSLILSNLHLGFI